MTRFHRITRWAVMALAVSALSLTGCDDDSTSASKAPEIESITASETTTTMGQTIQLIVVATDKNDAALNFQWSATGGTFSATDDDTVSWTAPEEEIIFTLTVKVDNDVEITTGTIDIGVGVYVPAVQPYYVGADACSGCHSATYTAWSATAHADAYDRKLEDLSDYCMHCHTVGYDDTVANGGWDENPVSELTNIQCESCHGPASAHLASTDKVNDPQISASLSEDACAPCHVSSRTSFWTDWAASGHATGASVVAGGYPGDNGSGSCATCHNGAAFVEFADTGSGSAQAAQIINCTTCHDPHDATNHYQLRLVTATNPDGVAITEGGAGALCMNCHTGRRSQSQIAGRLADGSEHFGPHHGNQGAFMLPAVYADPSGGTFTFTSSQHLLIEDSCATCHMHGEGEQPPATNGFSSHKFHPSVEACEPCHGTLTTFDDVMAKQDYDGSGTIDGVQTEVTGLLDLLETALYATGLDTAGTDNDIITAAGWSMDSTATWAAVDTLVYPLLMIRSAAWNYAAVDFDHSHGVHNAAFAIQLLQQSYLGLTGSDVPGGYMMLPGGY